MIDDLEDLIERSIALGRVSESLRLLKRLKQESLNSEEFSNSVARLFFEQMWHKNGAPGVWGEIIKHHHADLNEFDVLHMVRHATATDQFYLVYDLLNNNVDIDFSDADTLFGCLMCAPIEFCKNLDNMWDEDASYAVLPLAAVFNSDQRVLEHVVNRLNPNDVLSEIAETRDNNTVVWGDNIVIHVSDDVLDDVVEAINNAQATRIETHISSPNVSSPSRKI